VVTREKSLDEKRPRQRSPGPDRLEWQVLPYGPFCLTGAYDIRYGRTANRVLP
jgi:hypothetical protein